MASTIDAITLTKAERMELRQRAKSRTGRAEDARRARLVLLLADGHTWDEVCQRVDCSRGFVASWSRRFAEQRLAGLHSRHLGQRASVLTAHRTLLSSIALRRHPGLRSFFPLLP
jgi:transposase